MQMNIRRPLLSFSKQRLVATCEALNIPWIEDESNQDHTMTERNAIRHIVARHKLPAALSKSSLFHMDEEAEHKRLPLLRIAKTLFQFTNVQLDLRTASAIIAIPKLEDVEAKLAEIIDGTSSLSADSLSRVIGMYLEYICQLIHTPMVATSSKHMTVLFGDQVNRTRFTHNEVLFCPLEDGRWHVSPRHLHRGVLRRRLNKWAWRFQYTDPSSKYRTSRFRPLDDHWWINVSTPSPTQELVVTYLKPSHLKNLEARLASGDIILKDINDVFGSPRDLSLILKTLGQHSSRWWLPVILTRSQAEEKFMDGLSSAERVMRIGFAQDTDEQVLAFPTLNLRVHPKQRGAAPWWIENLSWEVWYKHLDGLDGRMEQSIVLPTSMEARGLKEVKPWRKP
jgi:hypothetical protein